jgi:hypothetical protein
LLAGHEHAEAIDIAPRAWYSQFSRGAVDVRE